MNLEKLKDPLPDDAVEWRISRSGNNQNGIWATAVAYKTSRADMDRLDEVCGPENWQDQYKPGPSGGVICGISIKIGDEWVTKWDGAENTNFEGVKGGLSDAFKRAGFKWGIGRYLYQIEEQFVETSLQKVQGWNYQSPNDKKGIPSFYWKTPNLSDEKASTEIHQDVAALQYQDGTSVAVGNSQKAKAEQAAFMAYCRSHDGDAPRNVHNLREWQKQQQK